MKKLSLNDIYLLKFAFYGGIACYDYAIGSKFMLVWLLLAILCIVIWVKDGLKTKTN